MLWDPFDPITYFLHTIVGTAGVVAATIALSSRKGARVHRRSGWVFACAALVAAGTAFVFHLTNPSVLVVTSSFMTLSLVVSSVLALRDRTLAVTIGESLALVVSTFSAGAVLGTYQVQVLTEAP